VPHLAKLPQLWHLRVDHLGAAQPSLASVLGRVLQALPVLRNVQLCHNDLGGAGMNALVPPLQQMTALESLDMRGNRVGDVEAGAVALATVVAHLTQLRNLTLAGNMLTDEDLEHLAPHISKCRLLTQLSLAGNAITPPRWWAFAPHPPPPARPARDRR
jgi:Ran GTPase-activating protein (RanGAP) involved in mRNA processing and transport